MEAILKRLDALPRWFVPIVSTCIMIELGLLYFLFYTSTLNPANRSDLRELY